MAGRTARHDVHIKLDEDDYLWARLQNFNFSERFGEYLKQVRREVEVTSYGLILKRIPKKGIPEERGTIP